MLTARPSWLDFSNVVPTLYEWEFLAGNNVYFYRKNFYPIYDRSPTLTLGVHTLGTNGFGGA
jgi:hypothetical protein